MNTRAGHINKPEYQMIADAVSNARHKTIPLAQATRLPAHRSLVLEERKRPPLDEVIIEHGFHCLVWFEEQPMGLMYCLRIRLDSDVPDMVPEKLAIAHIARAFGFLGLHCVWIEEYEPHKRAVCLAAKAERLQ